MTVSVKVLNVEEASFVKSKTGKTIQKQECTIADAGGTSRIVLWERDIGKMIIEMSYQIENATVRTYNGTKYLSVSETTVIVMIDDIGDVAEEECSSGGRRNNWSSIDR